MYPSLFGREIDDAQLLLDLYTPEELCQEEMAQLEAKVAAKSLGIPIPGQAKIMVTPRKETS